MTPDPLHTWPLPPQAVPRPPLGSGDSQTPLHLASHQGLGTPPSDIQAAPSESAAYWEMGGAECMSHPTWLRLGQKEGGLPGRRAGTKGKDQESAFQDAGRWEGLRRVFPAGRC